MASPSCPPGAPALLVWDSLLGVGLLVAALGAWAQWCRDRALAGARPAAVPPAAQGAGKSHPQRAAAQDAAALGPTPGANLVDTPETMNKVVPILPQVSPRRCVGGYC